MKSRIFLVILALGTAAVLLGAGYHKLNDKSLAPEQVVENFLLRMKEGDPKAAGELLAASPSYLDDVLMLKLNKIKRDYGFGEEDSTKREPTGSNRPAADGPMLNMSKQNRQFDSQKELQIISRTLDRSIVFEKVVSAIRHGHEAKVNASFKREGAANSNYSFLLIKEGEDWKIFMIYLNNNGPEFDLYEYWATARN